MKPNETANDAWGHEPESNTSVVVYHEHHGVSWLLLGLVVGFLLGGFTVLGFML